MNIKVLSLRYLAVRDKKSQLVIIMVSEISKNAATNSINIDNTVQGSPV